jgi:putative ABC transport system permease protein
MTSDTHIILELFKSASRLQKKRATLTIAAIAWGTVAILLLLAFGEGLKRQLNTNRKGMGENIAVLWPGETTKTYKGLPTGRPIRPRIDDIEFLRERIPEARTIIGEVVSWRTALTYGTKTVNARIIGTQPEYGEARNQFPQRGGRFISYQDDQQRRRVVFLGDALAKDIFGEEDPVGKTLLINNAPYTVIGVMKKKVQMGTYGGPDEDNGVIPINTFRAQFGRDRLNNVLIHVRKPEDMKPTLARFHQVAGAKFGYDPEDAQAFGTWDTVESSKITRNITIGIQLFLGIIGALTLIIGGVGVANIMYAVVKERTREIGVKMALGAKARWIVAPFVLEGLIYTLVGGAFGIMIATILIIAASFIPGDSEVMQFLGKPTLSWQIGVGTSFILGLIGVLAGYFPARRAANVDPAATLRYE